MTIPFLDKILNRPSSSGTQPSDTSQPAGPGSPPDVPAETSQEQAAGIPGLFFEDQLMGDADIADIISLVREVVENGQLEAYGEPISLEQLASRTDPEAAIELEHRLGSKSREALASLLEAIRKKTGAGEEDFLASWKELTIDKALKEKMGIIRDEEFTPNMPHKNHSDDPADDTKAAKTARLMEKSVIAGIIKVTVEAAGSMSRLFWEHIGDGRAQAYVQYPKTVLLVFGLLAHLVGIQSWNDADYIALHPVALDTLGKLAGCPGNFGEPGYKLTKVPDEETANRYYETIPMPTDPWEVSPFQKMGFAIVRKLFESKRYQDARIRGRYRIIFDGTGFGHARTPFGENCLYQRHTREDGTSVMVYLNKAVVARLVIGEHTSIPMGVEFITNEKQDVSKQDCENRAAMRLLCKIHDAFPKMGFFIQGDSLYGTDLLMKLCTRFGYECMFTVKSTTQPSIFEEFVRSYNSGLMEEEYIRVPGILEKAEDGYECGYALARNHMENIKTARKSEMLEELSKHLDLEKEPLEDGPLGMIYYAREARMDSREAKEYMKRQEKEKNEENAQWARNKGNAPEDTGTDAGDKKKDKGAETRRAKAKELQEAIRQMDQDLIRRNREGSEQRKKTRGQTQKPAQEGAGQAYGTGSGIPDAQAEEQDASQTVILTFSWICNFVIEKADVEKLVKTARGRWIIETSFYTQKHSGLNLEHLWAKTDNALKVHFWLVQFADMIFSLYFMHDDAGSVYDKRGMLMKEIASSLERDSLNEKENQIYLIRKQQLRNREEKRRKRISPAVRAWAEGQAMPGIVQRE